MLSQSLGIFVLMLFSVRTVRGSWPHPGSGCCQVQAPPSTGAGSWAGWSGIAGSGTRLSKKWRLKWVRIPPVVNHQIVRLQTKIAPLKKCDTYKNVDRKCLKVTLGSRPKRNHFQVVVRAKNVDRKYFLLCQIVTLGSRPKNVENHFQVEQNIRHQAENIFCYVKLLLWDQDQKNVGGTIFKLRLEQQDIKQKIFLLCQDFSGIKTMLGTIFKFLKKL